MFLEYVLSPLNTTFYTYRLYMCYSFILIPIYIIIINNHDIMLLLIFAYLIFFYVSSSISPCMSIGFILYILNSSLDAEVNNVFVDCTFNQCESVSFSF